MLPDLLTVEELAALLRTTPSTIYDMRAAGRCPRGIRAGKRVLFRRSEVEAFLDERTEPRPADAP